MPGQFERLSGFGFHFPQAAVSAGQYAVAHPGEHKAAPKEEPPRPPVFITVSREPGAGALSLSHRLAERLNTLMQQSGHEPELGAAAAPEWRAWDRELVEKVSQESGITRSVIETIDERPHSWLDEFLQGFSQSGTFLPEAEMRAYKRVATTIGKLAAAGHAIIVGRGGVFVTRSMPGGLHLRLVATLEQRIKLMSSTYSLTLNKAASRIRELEHNRATFFHRFWPGKSLTPEIFTLTLNSGEMSLDEIVESVVPIIRARDPSLSQSADVGGVLSL
jgi:cytidylate kinase